jgi:hypothetical protein
VDHYFVSGEKVRRYFVPVPGMDLDAVTHVEREGALMDGTPFILGPDVRPAEPLCSFFCLLRSLAPCAGVSGTGPESRSSTVTS